MSITGIGELGTMGDDIVKGAEELLAETQPLRQFNIMNKLVAKIKAVCLQYPNSKVADVVLALCNKLNAPTQQALINLATEQMAAPAVQPKPATLANKNFAPQQQKVFSNTYNKINIKMEATTDPNLNQDELSLTTALGKLAIIIGLYIGKAETFIEAALNGITGIAPGTAVTLPMVINQAFTVLLAIATLTNYQPFIKLVVIAQTLYNDTTGNTKGINVFNLFAAYIRSSKARNTAIALAAATAKASDATLLDDELSLSTQIGILVKYIALYLGSLPGAAAGKAESFVNAFMTGVSEVDDTQTTTLKDVVDGSFSVLSILGSIINNAIVSLIINAVWALYDDFAGGKTNLEALWAEISKTKTAILAASKPAVAVAAKVEVAAKPAVKPEDLPSEEEIDAQIDLANKQIAEQEAKVTALKAQKQPIAEATKG